MTQEDLVSLADKRLSDWQSKAHFWYLLYYFLGGVTVVLTVTVASRPEFLDQRGLIPTIAWMAAIFQGFGTFVLALPKATAYRTAWRRLWLARLDYVDSDKSESTRYIVKDAIARGWEIIDGGYSDPKSCAGKKA